MKKRKEPPVIDRKSFWMQEAACELLMADLAKKKAFASGLIAYYALAGVASESDSEPGPDRDGQPFKVSVARLAHMVNQPVPLTMARLRDFDRIGLINPMVWPINPHEPVIMRIRTIADPEVPV